MDGHHHRRGVDTHLYSVCYCPTLQLPCHTSKETLHGGMAQCHCIGTFWKSTLLTGHTLSSVLINSKMKLKSPNLSRPGFPLARCHLRHQTIPQRRRSPLGPPQRRPTNGYTILVLAVDFAGGLHPERTQHGRCQFTLPAIQTQTVAQNPTLVRCRH